MFMKISHIIFKLSCCDADQYKTLNILIASRKICLLHKQEQRQRAYYSFNPGRCCVDRAMISVSLVYTIRSGDYKKKIVTNQTVHI